MKRLTLAVLLSAFASGCATNIRREAMGDSPFAFSLSPELCERLRHERGTYTSVGKVSTYLSGATALLTPFLLGFVSEKTAPAASAGVTLAASATAIFSGAQADSLSADLDAGGCNAFPAPATR